MRSVSLAWGDEMAGEPTLRFQTTTRTWIQFAEGAA